MCKLPQALVGSEEESLALGRVAESVKGQFEPKMTGTQSGSSTPDSSRKLAGRKPAGMCQEATLHTAHLSGWVTSRD
jgi:hypothetical protein